MRLLNGGVVGLLALAASSAVVAQDLGQREFMNSCAQCHGPDGSGGGVMAGYLMGTLPDLTTLQKDNGGVFPVARLYAVIEGGDAPGPHGTRDMPAWGDRYNAQAPAMLGEIYSSADQESFVRGRILALIEYISTLQVE